MHATEMRRLLLEHRLVAVLRMHDSEAATRAGLAVIAGGARIVEVTWTVPGAAQVLATLKRSAAETVAVGAGTVLDERDLEVAIAAGADFAISPDVNEVLIDGARNRGILHVPGAMTATEILTAARAGAPCVKLFPIASVGGAAHVRALRGPIPDVPFLVSGGVDLDTLDEFLDAGASAVGLTTTLIPPDWLAAREHDRIADLTRRYLERLERRQ